MPKIKRTGVSKVNDIVSEPIIKEPKAQKSTNASPLGEVVAKTQQKAEDMPIDSLINLVVAYTTYTKSQARNLITGVIARESHLLVNDVVDWCIYLKELETNLSMVSAVADGSALVEKIDGKWTLLDRVKS